MASCHNNSSPGFLSVFDRFLEVGVEQEVFEVWIGIEGLFDPIEELGTDDATTSQGRSIRARPKPTMTPKSSSVGSPSLLLA